MTQHDTDHAPTAATPGDPAPPRGGLTRRTAVAGTAWTVPALVVTAAAPAFATSGALTLTPVTPGASSFSEDTAASRQVVAVLRRDGAEVGGADVTFTLTDDSWLQLASSRVLTTSDGRASTVLQAVPGALPAPGAETVLTASHGTVTTAWTVTYRPFSALAGGSTGQHVLALADGRLYGWGYSTGGIGDGTTSTRLTPHPVDRTVLTAPTAQVVRGEYHSLAVDAAGRLFVWGGNANAQVGDGTTDARTAPVEVLLEAAPSTVAHVAGGNTHSVAVSSTGRIYGWGGNAFGQLGPSTLGSQLPAPTELDRGEIPVGVTVTALVAGANHTVILGSDGWLYAWGRNIAGQVGVGEATSRVGAPRAVSRGDVPAGVTMTAVSAGASHTLALGTDGHVYAWGANQWGEVGTGSTGPLVLSPTRVVAGAVPGGVEIVDVVAGNHHSVALGSDGRLYAWGRNDVGQLGDGTLDAKEAPVVVARGAMSPSSRVVALTAGVSNTYAITDDRLTYAWGERLLGRIGDGSSSGSATSPVKVTVVP